MCWFDCVCYHETYIHLCKERFSFEMSQSPASVRDLLTLFSDSWQVEELCLQLTFIAKECSCFTILNGIFQSRKPCATKVIETSNQLVHELEVYETMTMEECGDCISSSNLLDFEEKE